jgi:hypothetical protein
MSHSQDDSMNPDHDTPDKPTRDESIELQSFAAQLAQLSPRTDRLDRERLIFLAGQASVSPGFSQPVSPSRDWRRHPIWPAAFAGMSMLSAALLAILLARSTATDSTVRDFSSFASNEFDDANTVARPTRPQTSSRAANALSPRDARRADIEFNLSKSTQLIDGAPQVIEPHRPVLTPAAWNELSEQSVPALPPTDSSNVSTLRDVQS